VSPFLSGDAGSRIAATTARSAMLVQIERRLLLIGIGLLG
jgi:hypothetical protein